MRLCVTLLLICSFLLPLAAPASALPCPRLRRAEVPGLAAARLAVRGLKRQAEHSVLGLAGAEARQEAGHAKGHEVRRTVNTAVLDSPSPAPVPARLAELSCQRLQDLTAHALAQMRGEPLRARTAPAA